MSTVKSHIEAAILEAFPLETGERWHETRGVMALPITGHFLRSVEMPALVAAIRAVVPLDARLYSLDGDILRMRHSVASPVSDQYFLVITSKDFDLIKEGESFRPMAPIYYGEKPAEFRADDELPATQVHTLFGSTFDTHEFIIDKTTHTFEIPRERETEDRIVIVVKPK
jgi:hypothetical protein